MMHTKFQCHRHFVFGEDFKVFTIFGHGGYLGKVTWTVWTNFRSPIPCKLHMKFSEEKMFENVDLIQTSDNRGLSTL